MLIQAIRVSNELRTFMKIGIDCRMYGPKHTGIGRYVQNLVENLLEIDKENSYVLFVKDDRTEEIENLKIKYSFKIDNLKLKIIPSKVQHYSFKFYIPKEFLGRDFLVFRFARVKRDFGL